MQWSSNWLDYLTLSVSVLAAIFAFKSNKIANKSLALSERQEKQKEPQIKLFLESCFSKGIKDGVSYVFSILVSNPSSADNSLTSCELEITYKRKDGTLGNLFLRHERTLLGEIGLNDVTAFNIPCDIKAHCSVAGVAVFKLDFSLEKDLHIEGYKVMFRDISSHEATIKTATIGGDPYDR